jgi:hypothetical protein
MIITEHQRGYYSVVITVSDESLGCDAAVKCVHVGHSARSLPDIYGCLRIIPSTPYALKPANAHECPENHAFIVTLHSTHAKRERLLRLLLARHAIMLINIPIKTRQYIFILHPFEIRLRKKRQHT